MSISIDSVPRFQVLDVRQDDTSYLSLFVSGLDDAHAAALTASLGGTNSLFFREPPSVQSATPTSVPSQYLVILALTGRVADGSGGLADCDVLDVETPLDPAFTVTVTAGDLGHATASVFALLINPN